MITKDVEVLVTYQKLFAAMFPFVGVVPIETRHSTGLSGFILLKCLHRESLETVETSRAT